MRRKQVATEWISVKSIMTSRAFVIGASEVRAGRRPNFDRFIDPNDAWNYERGRQWAMAAPRDMKLKVGKRLNRGAVVIFNRSHIP